MAQHCIQTWLPCDFSGDPESVLLSYPICCVCFFFMEGGGGSGPPAPTL